MDASITSPSTSGDLAGDPMPEDKHDRIPAKYRVLIYLVSLLLPSAGLYFRLLTGIEATAVLTVLMGTIGPAIALAYTDKDEEED